MATSSVGGVSQIGIQDFLRILVAQLNNQDPLKPLDSQEFVGQLAQFASLQQTQDLNQRMSDLLLVQSASQSIGLLGRNVDVSTPGGGISGKVSALGFANGEPRLTLTKSDGSVVTDITLASIISIR
jgi:flagellar basal-body rod modification protein FlgD